MIRRKAIFSSFLLIIGLISGCIKLFEPPFSATDKFLVVDGHIYIEEKKCKVKLTRSQAIRDPSSPKAEKNAQVNIEDIFGNSYALTNQDSSIYSISNFDFKYNVKYRLRIKTNDGKEFLSEYISTGKTPTIDSIQFTRGINKVWHANVYTHDPSNNTWYYLWKYVETYKYVSGAKSQFETKNNEIIKRIDDIHTCWKNENSNTIITNTSKKLNADIIFQQKLNTIYTESRKFDMKYSILVKQYAIGADEYNYWKMLQKSNETTGSLFDPQPTQVTGNFKCLNDPGEVILGYFSPYSESQKRKTIEVYKDYQPDWFNTSLNCQVLTFFPGPNLKYFSKERGCCFNIPDFFNIIKEYHEDGKFNGYLVSTKECVDCRSKLYGGTNIEPEFMK